MGRVERFLVFLGVAVGGFAALGWELIWQIRTSLAIGVSSQATALVIATTMGGMALGTVSSGLSLERLRPRAHPLLLYAALELTIGACGWFLGLEFEVARHLDTAAYRAASVDPALLHLGLIALTIGPPSFAMGASVPVLGLVADRTSTSLALLYGINTLGAALGTLTMAFLVVPAAGVTHASTALSLLNAVTATLLFFLSRSTLGAGPAAVRPRRGGSSQGALPFVVVFLTGFSVFALEVIFFRAMRSAFLSTTHTFAVILGSVLLALSLGASAAKLLVLGRSTVGSVLALGGASVLIAVPLVEHLDSLASFYALDPHLSNFFLALGVIGPVICVLGVLFPFFLEGTRTPRQWGLLHASNTFGAIAGALSAAWILLPTLGMARSAWLVALVLLFAGAATSSDRRSRLTVAVGGSLAFFLAVAGQSGIGETRIVGQHGELENSAEVEIVAYREAPDYTVSVVSQNGNRALYIDGFSASSTNNGSVGYMAWMGRLPMLVHPHPENALLICYGRGETAQALLQEAPASIDIVDISATVFEMAPLFPANAGVLKDPRVTAIVMDGRAWLRRTTRVYDVITLEPMPPTFAGVNSLYSREFYELASDRLSEGGTIAQWVPFHLITPDQTTSIVRTFTEVFPEAVLWIHSEGTGILLGKKSSGAPIDWPGFMRDRPGRDLSPDEVRASVVLEASGLARLGRDAVVITDDNQYLAYSGETRRNRFTADLGAQHQRESYERIFHAKEAR